MDLKAMTDWVDYGFIGIMVFMSVVALWLVLERYFFYRHVDIRSYATKEELEIALGENLTMVASIGSNAPFIGLLGTVIGIMVTFTSIGQSGLVETKEIMIGLALALKTTAGGILVAIPTIWFYNLLLRRMEIILARWDIAEKKGRDAL